MHKTAHQQVLTLVGGPHQFQAGQRRPFADFIPVGNQSFSGGEVVRLMHQCQMAAIEPCLYPFQAATGEAEAEGCEQLSAAHPIFHRHPLGSMEHHWDARGRQHQSRERIDRRRSAAPVERHAEAQGRLLTGECRPATPVDVQHPGEFLGLGPADAVGNQKGADLGRRGHTIEHQLHGIGGFLAAQATAGVFTTAHLAEVGAEPNPLFAQPLSRFLHRSERGDHANRCCVAGLNSDSQGPAGPGLAALQEQSFGNDGDTAWPGWLSTLWPLPNGCRDGRHSEQD